MGKKNAPARHAARDGERVSLCGRLLWQVRLTVTGDERPTCRNCARVWAFQRRRRARDAGTGRSSE